MPALTYSLLVRLEPNVDEVQQGLARIATAGNID